MGPAALTISSELLSRKGDRTDRQQLPTSDFWEAMGKKGGSFALRLVLKSILLQKALFPENESVYEYRDTTDL